MRSLIVSLHDVAPGSFAASRKWMELFDSQKIAVSMLVIPGSWSGTSLSEDVLFQNWLKDVVKNKHEIVLHGYSHQAKIKLPFRPLKTLSGAVLARGCEEFWTLSQDEAQVRLKSGLAVLGQLGFKPSGFIAPGWLASKETVNALRLMSFGYTNSHFLVRDLARDKKFFAPVVCQRTGATSSRLVLRLTHILANVLGFLRLPIRIAVHPDDLHDPIIRAGIIRIVDRALARGYESVTYEKFIGLMSRPEFDSSQSQFLSVTS